MIGFVDMPAALFFLLSFLISFEGCVGSVDKAFDASLDSFGTEWVLRVLISVDW